jgi:hypothetical protein
MLFFALSFLYENLSNMEHKLNHKKKAAMQHKAKHEMAKVGVCTTSTFKYAEKALMDLDVAASSGASKEENLLQAQEKMNKVFQMKAAIQLQALMPEVKKSSDCGSVKEVKEALAAAEGVKTTLRHEIASARAELLEYADKHEVKRIMTEALTKERVIVQAEEKEHGNPFDKVPEGVELLPPITLKKKKKKKKKKAQEGKSGGKDDDLNWDTKGGDDDILHAAGLKVQSEKGRKKKKKESKAKPTAGSGRRKGSKKKKKK